MKARKISSIFILIVALSVLSGCNRTHASILTEYVPSGDLISSAPAGSAGFTAGLSGSSFIPVEPSNSIATPNDIASTGPIIAPTMELVGNWVDNISTVSEKNDIYEIYSPEELAWVASTVNNGQSFAGKIVMLMADIDLAGKEWTPIGAHLMSSAALYKMSTTFTGTFDGNYKVIKNLSIGTEGKPSQYGKTVELGGGMSRSGYVGLFGICGEFGITAPETVIKNIGLEDVSIYTVAGGAGALIGLSWGAYVENCYTTGKIISYAPEVTAGGLIAELSAWNEISVNNCYSKVNLSCGNGDADELFAGLGGLIGNIDNANKPVIVNCYAIGNTNTAGRHGGLLGRGNYSFVKGGIVSSYHNADVNEYMVQSVDFFWEPGFEEIKMYARTTAELKTQSTYKDWDFVNTWGINENRNDGYPYLRGFTLNR